MPAFEAVVGGSNPSGCTNYLVIMTIQEKQFREIISKNEIIVKILEIIPDLNLKNWYVGSKCITQTIWNYEKQYFYTKRSFICNRNT